MPIQRRPVARSMTRFAPYIDPSSPPPVPKRWKRSLAPLRSTSTDNSITPQPAHKGTDRKGKGKARHIRRGVIASQAEENAWNDIDALLAQSFTIHRLSFSSHLPFSSSSSAASLADFSSSLLAFLKQQTSLGHLVGERGKTIERVEAGFIDLPMFGKQGKGVRPVLLEIEIERGVCDEDNVASTSSAPPASRLSTFVFLPASSSSAFPLLLTKSPSPSITSLVHKFLTSRYDATILPFRVPPSAMLDLLTDLVLHRNQSFDEIEGEIAEADKGLATNLTFAFPPSIATEGLSTLTLTLPPPILPFLSSPATSFATALSRHIHSIASISLSSLFLVRLGVGRGTFIHSGHGAGEGGAKVKFFRGAEEDGALKRVLEILILVAEGERR